MNLSEIIDRTSKELRDGNIPTYYLDSLILLKKAISESKEYIISHPDDLITNQQYSKFRRLIRKRKKGMPIAYILGQKEFFGYAFFVNKNVLIPRPETELIVEEAIKFVKFKVDKVCKIDKVKIPLKIVDIGTGSGNIIISIIKNCQEYITHNTKYDIQYFASDISKKTLYVAKKNAQHHRVNKYIRFYKSDLFFNPKMPKKYDLIIANLPYLPKASEKLKVTHCVILSKRSKSKDLWKSPLLYEPTNSIFANDKGSKVIKRFIDQVKTRINNNGLILIEADPRNINDISIYAKKHLRYSKIEIIKDLAGLERIIEILT